jgi:hypothetical protein
LRYENRLTQVISGRVVFCSFRIRIVQLDVGVWRWGVEVEDRCVLDEQLENPVLQCCEEFLVPYGTHVVDPREVLLVRGTGERGVE